MSELRETPTEAVSEKTIIPISTPHNAYTAHVTERISKYEFEVLGLKSEIAILKKTLVEMKQVQHGQQQDLATLKLIVEQVLARFPPVQSSQSTPDLLIEDNTTKGEKE